MVASLAGGGVLQQQPCRFSQDGVRVVVAQPADASASETKAYNSAHRQCSLHIISNAAHLSEAETSGKLSSPVTEVHILDELLQKLPLLQDFSELTTQATHMSYAVSGKLRGAAEVRPID